MLVKNRKGQMVDPSTMKDDEITHELSELDKDYMWAVHCKVNGSPDAEKVMDEKTALAEPFRKEKEKRKLFYYTPILN
jgi:formaldehyde-activating enzyme involved in methanogenesis